MVNRVLMVAYHYPPVQVSSGLQRTLAFSRYLSEHDWEPIVLSAHPRAYETTSQDQLKDIPERAHVERAFALDTSRHLSIKGSYLSWMALPDKWVSWWFGGVWSGIRLIRKFSPKAIWATYPIATALLIGWTLHKLTGLPLIVDFRDTVTDPEFPSDKRKRAAHLWIEKKIVYSARVVVLTTSGAVEMYRGRYPDVPNERWALIPNGYNEAIFTEVEKTLAHEDKSDSNTKPKTINLVHSGVIYPHERNPTFFFQALSDLKKEGLVDKGRLQVILRGTGHDRHYLPVLEKLDIEDLVELAPGVPYREALKGMLSADGLLLLQGKGCNHQVPAKLYEYFRAGRPILALTDRNGDTASILVSEGFEDISPMDCVDEIKRAIISFLEKVEGGIEISLRSGSARRYSRELLSSELVNLLNAAA